MTEQVKHTPGPWRAELVQSMMGHGYTRWQWNIVGPGGSVAEIYAKFGRTANCPEEANARIIAAAPLMLDALIARRDADHMLENNKAWPEQEAKANRLLYAALRSAGALVDHQSASEASAAVSEADGPLNER